jgi:hypothetical protein
MRCASFRSRLDDPSRSPTLQEDDNPSERVRVRWKSAAFLRRRHRPHTCSADRNGHEVYVSIPRMTMHDIISTLRQHKHMRG